MAFLELRRQPRRHTIDAVLSRQVPLVDHGLQSRQQLFVGGAADIAVCCVSRPCGRHKYAAIVFFYRERVKLVFPAGRPLAGQIEVRVKTREFLGFDGFRRGVIRLVRRAAGSGPVNRRSASADPEERQSGKNRRKYELACVPHFQIPPFQIPRQSGIKIAPNVPKNMNRKKPTAARNGPQPRASFVSMNSLHGEMLRASSAFTRFVPPSGRICSSAG